MHIKYNTRVLSLPGQFPCTPVNPMNPLQTSSQTALLLAAFCSLNHFRMSTFCLPTLIARVSLPPASPSVPLPLPLPLPLPRPRIPPSGAMTGDFFQPLFEFWAATNATCFPSLWGGGGVYFHEKVVPAEQGTTRPDPDPDPANVDPVDKEESAARRGVSEHMQDSMEDPG